jgi:hypothetical protein
MAEIHPPAYAILRMNRTEAEIFYREHFPDYIIFDREKENPDNLNSNGKTLVGITLNKEGKIISYQPIPHTH